MADASTETLLRRRLSVPLGGQSRWGETPHTPRPSRSAEHPDPELIAAHAADELPPEYALAITRHLAVCDGRCAAVLRDVIAGAAVAREALYGPREEPVDTAPASRLPPSSEGRSDRSFECNDVLWEVFEALAQEAGEAPEALIEEAMQAYAQLRTSLAGPVAPRSVAFMVTPSVVPEPFNPPRERNTPTLQRAYLPRPQGAPRRRVSPPPLRAEAGDAGRAPFSMGPQAAPNPGPAGRAHAPPLRVVLGGVAYAVNKERFVVGRGGRSSDLAIDDPGVSRQHAVIERAGEGYWLVDMGSTNGVEYEGERIARKRIAHGDCFRIGDSELRFLFDELPG